MAEVAERFRYYAALCRAQADTAHTRALRLSLLGQAERWEKDAAMVERDARMIASSRALLAAVDQQLTPRGGTSLAAPEELLVTFEQPPAISRLTSFVCSDAGESERRGKGRLRRGVDGNAEPTAPAPLP